MAHQEGMGAGGGRGGGSKGRGCKTVWDGAEEISNLAKMCVFRRRPKDTKACTSSDVHHVPRQ